MPGRRQAIDVFIERMIREVEAAEADGVSGADALAKRFNARGLTTLKGRPWNAATVRKLLSSPAVKARRKGPKPAPDRAP